MKDFEALKDIWTGQKSVPAINSEEVLQQAKKNKAAYTDKLLIETVLMLAVVVALVAVLLLKSFVLWTSHLSLAILVSCCLYYLYFQFRDYRTLNSDDSSFTQPETFIARLKEYKQRRYRLNTRIYTSYSIFIGLAFALYFIEVFVAAPLWQTISAVLFTVLWFVFCALMMRSYRRKEEAKLNEMILNLEKLQRQFEE